jgi:carboxyl-terminal processing protease
MKARGALAYAVSLLAFLAAGLWLGGHPAKLPEPIRDAFTGSAAGLNAEAAELIEDNYFRAVGETELGNASLQGMVRELRQRHGDRFTEYFSPESLESFNQALAGRFSGVGLSVVPAKRGLRAVTVFKGSPAAAAGIVAGDTVVVVDG